ncbi:MAG: porin family protein [Prevotella sp.]|nr:porin family protein [Prevotella sp.]
MKKVMMIAAMMLMSIGAFAQGQFSIGASAGLAAYGDEYNPFGVGAKAQYSFTENFRGELDFNYWFPKDKAGVMDFDLNVQYLIPINEKINVYPLVGANLAMTHGDAWKILFDEQQTLFGFQGGVGIEYFLTDNVKANFDVKYQSNKKTKTYNYMGYSMDYELKYDGPVFQVGIAYVF